MGDADCGDSQANGVVMKSKPYDQWWHQIKMRWAAMLFRRSRDEFYEDLAEALDDKVNLADFLEKRRRRAALRGSSEAIVLSSWLRKMDDMSFSRAIAATVPNMDATIIAAGEGSGELVEGLRFLSQTMRAISKMTNVLRKAVATPIVLIIMNGAIMWGFSTFMVPMLSQLIKPEHWPPVGKALYASSMLVTNHGLTMAVAVVATLVTFGWSLGNWAGPRRVMVDRYLPYSIYRNYMGSVFLVTLASLLNARISLVDALAKMRATSNPWMRWHVATMLRKLDYDSDQPGRALNTGILPGRVADRIGDATGRMQFDQIMTRIGMRSMEKTQVFVEQSAALLNSLLLLFTAALLMFAIVGFMTTALEVQNAVRAPVQIR